MIETNFKNLGSLACNLCGKKTSSLSKGICFLCSYKEVFTPDEIAIWYSHCDMPEELMNEIK